MPIVISLLIIVICFYVMTEIVEKHFIKSLDNIANWLKIPSSVAGATLLAFGTSAPEISMALVAFFNDQANPAIGLGTIIGSAIFQILVVIGFAAWASTAKLSWKPILRDSLFYAFSIFLLIWIVKDGNITFFEASLFIFAYGLYLFLLFLWTRFIGEEEPEKAIVSDGEKTKRSSLKKLKIVFTYPISFLFNFLPDVEKKPKWTLPVFAFCLFIIGYASYWLVIAAESFAQSVGVAQAIIALTILAGGSSIPEMISSAFVAKQGRGDMAIANAIGSNIFDILMSLGLPVFIYTIVRGRLTDFADTNIQSSTILLFLSLILVLALLFMVRFKPNKLLGWVLIVLYIVYVYATYRGWLEQLSLNNFSL